MGIAGMLTTVRMSIAAYEKKIEGKQATRYERKER
jgi:hypothetical protein